MAADKQLKSKVIDFMGLGEQYLFV